MSNLAVFDFEGQVIRSTGDGRFSVFDVLVAFIPPAERKGQLGKGINPRDVYARIASQHPEVVGFVDSFKFPGRGQRETPVATEEGVYQILMLCPGKRGAEFRAWAAKLVRERIEEERDGELAYTRGRERAARVWRRNGLSERDIAARIEGIERRHAYTDTLKAHGVSPQGYARCTNAIYLELFDGTAAELKQQRGLAKRQSLRDSFDYLESAANMFAEAKATRDIESRQLRGDSQCQDASKKAARAVRKALDE